MPVKIGKPKDGGEAQRQRSSPCDASQSQRCRVKHRPRTPPPSKISVMPSNIVTQPFVLPTSNIINQPLASPISNSLPRHIHYFRHRREIMKSISETVISTEDDGRPYAKVTIENIPMFGLLDSGANLSILGSGCEQFITCTSKKFHNFPSFVHTASGSQQRVLGYVILDVLFSGESHPIKFYLVPNLTQKLYLGIDFWNAFGLKINIVSELTTNPNPIMSGESAGPDKYHDMAPTDKKLLDGVIGLFPSFTKNGLGRTTLLKHEIDVGECQPIKQHHYPVSPAVQAEIYSEIDRMISLDVIEESQRPWCSTIALVRKKSGKARLCLDARKINKSTKKDAYPLRLIEGLLSRLDYIRHITALDLKDAFWQISLKDKSKEITAFAIPGRPLY